MNVEKIIESIRSVIKTSSNTNWFEKIYISRDDMEEFISLLDSSEYLKFTGDSFITRSNNKRWDIKYNYYCLALDPRTIVVVIFTDFDTPLHCVEVNKDNANKHCTY